MVAALPRRRLHWVARAFKPGWDTYIERQGYGIEAHLAFDEVSVNDYEAVLVLGGRAPEYLRNNRRLIRLVQEFHQTGKWVFAICHGIQVLITAGLAKGARLTAYEHLRYEIESGGGEYITEEAVRDGRIVTAQT